jgi:hypothetical protein
LSSDDPVTPAAVRIGGRESNQIGRRLLDMNHATPLLATLAFVATGFVSTAANAQVFVSAPPVVVAAGPIVVAFGAPPPPPRVVYMPPPPPEVVYVEAQPTVVYARASYREPSSYRPVVSHRPVVVHQQHDRCHGGHHHHSDRHDRHAQWRGRDTRRDDHRDDRRDDRRDDHRDDHGNWNHGKGPKHRR